MELKNLLPTLVCTIFFCLTQIERASGQSLSNEKVNVLSDERINALIAKYKVPAVGIGIIENGKIKQVKVYGEHQKNGPAPKNTIFNVASITKPVTAMLALKLVEMGQLDLDTPLDKHYIDPEIKDNPWYKKITPRIILSHQTGFGNWRVNHPSKKLVFEFEPGTRFGYSGEGYEYLRLAIERKTNKYYFHLLDSILYAPLGMKDTQFWNDRTDSTRFAHWYDSRGREYNTSYKTGVSSADDLLTTVEDLCKLGVAVMNKKLIGNKQLYNDMITPHAKLGEGLGWGLGWQVISGLPSGEYALEHGGSDMGAKASVLLLPNSKRGIVILTNGDNGGSIIREVIKESFNIGKDIIETMNPTSSLPKTVPVSRDILKEYEGTYLQPTGREMEIVLVDNNLFITGAGWPMIEMFPEAENKFFGVEYRVHLVFDKEDKRKAVLYNEKGEIIWELIRK